MLNPAESAVPRAFDPPLAACPLCTGDQIRMARIDYTGIRIDRCRSCGVEFMNPQYTDAYLQAFYDHYQRDLAKRHRFGDDPKPRRLIHTHNLEQIESYRAPGRFLSVGCGQGIDLTVAVERGWAAEGYDVDEGFVREQSAALGLPIHSGEFCALDGGTGFDCVYLNHVLEHPKRPGAYLEKISSLLKPGGILYIACPNIGSPSSRLKNLQDTLHLRGTPAKHYDTWQHLVYYTPRRLARVLDRRYEFQILYRGSDIKARRGEDQVRVAPLARLCLKSTFRLLARRR